MGAEREDFETIGGWLLLVGVGILLTPIKIAMSIITDYGDTFGLPE